MFTLAPISPLVTCEALRGPGSIPPSNQDSESTAHPLPLTVLHMIAQPIKIQLSSLSSHLKVLPPRARTLSVWFHNKPQCLDIGLSTSLGAISPAQNTWQCLEFSCHKSGLGPWLQPHQVGGGRRCCSTSSGAQDGPPQKVLQPQSP